VGGDLLTRVQNGHSGQNVLGLGCMGADHGDGHYRGYVTIDNVNECSTLFAYEAGYFVDGGNGIASNVNQLFGDFYVVDSTNDFAQGDVLVHVEADDLLNSGASATGYTFYGRYDAALLGADNREPLGTTWGARYLNGGDFDGGTSLTVWRDSTTNNTNEFYACGNSAGAGPDWFPMNETEVVAFNEREDAVLLCFSGPGGVISPPTSGSDPACFPYEAGNYAYGEGFLNGPYNFGWLYLNLNFDDVGVSNDVDFGSNSDISQSYVMVNHDALERFSVGYSASKFTSAFEDVSPLVSDTGTIPDN
jgi:hypothetical protein